MQQQKEQESLCQQSIEPSNDSSVTFTEWQLLRRKAYYEINRARARGVIQPAKAFSCLDCGKQAYVYDHRNYLFPLMVDPVCYACNTKRGRAFPVISNDKERLAALQKAKSNKKILTRLNYAKWFNGEIDISTHLEIIEKIQSDYDDFTKNYWSTNEHLQNNR